MAHFDFAKAALSVKINQIAALIKVSILKAAHRGSVCSVAGVHAGIAAVEAEVARIGTTHRTAPIAAVGTDKAERTIAEEFNEKLIIFNVLLTNAAYCLSWV